MSKLDKPSIPTFYKFLVILAIVGAFVAVFLGGNAYIQVGDKVGTHHHPGHVALIDIDYNSIDELKDDLKKIRVLSGNVTNLDYRIALTNYHLDSNATVIDDLVIDISIIEAGGDIISQPGTTPTIDTIDLNLKLQGQDGNFKTSFLRSENFISIQGETEFIKKAYKMIIIAPSGSTITKETNTDSNGAIREAFLPNDKSEIGEYKITFQIDNKFDSITFTLV